MATRLIPSSLLLLLLSLISAATSGAQAPSTRNIQVQFPAFPAPAFQIPLPPPPAQAPAPTSTTPPPPQQSSTSKVRVAVAITASSSIALCALLFSAFFFLTRRLQIRVGDGALPERPDSAPKGQTASGGIVDENGLDAIYWREFNEKRCPFCHNELDASEGREEGDSGGGGGGGADGSSPEIPGRIQERPLIPAGSISSSQSFSSEQSTPSLFSFAAVRTARSAKHMGVSRQESATRPAGRSNSASSLSSAAGPPQSLPPRPPTMTSIAASAPLPAPESKAPPSQQPPETSISSATPPAPPPPPVAKSIPASPPPPPPPPPGKTPPAAPPSRPPLPPPSPPTGGGRTAIGPSSAAAVAADAATKKLKPLHWDKMIPDDAQHSMVWDKITDGSFRFDEDILEVLFGTMATNRKSPAGGKAGGFSGNSGPSTTTTAMVSLLDPRRSQNIAIVLRSLSLSRTDILDALVEGRGLPVDVLERLIQVAPTKEEAALIRSYEGSPAKLTEADSFLFHILRAVPSPFARFNAMLFRANYEPEVAQLRQSLEMMEAACKELKARGLLLKLLEAVLKAGNLMNAGTARGNAQAFNLSALCKLSDVKSTDGSTTLLHFVVEEVVRSEGKRLVVKRNRSFGPTTLDRTTSHSSASGTREEREKEYIKLGLPIVGGISDEFSSVRKAATIDPDALAGTCASLTARLTEIQQFLDTCGNDGFTREMRAFAAAAAEDLRAARAEQGRVMDLVRGVTDYYQPGASRSKGGHPLRLFVIVRDFLNMVDKTCVDIARNLQTKKKPQAEASSGRSSGSPTSESSGRDRKPVARFPCLPPNFLSENSKSESSSDDEAGS